MDAADPHSVIALEKSLLERSTRSDRALLERMLADEMVEFGKSGSAHGKQSIVEALMQERAAPAQHLEMADARVVQLAPGAVLLTYRLVPMPLSIPDAVPSLRSSTWIWRDGRWQLLFHQGTVAAAGA